MFIALEGNIGVGKSEFLKIVSNSEAFKSIQKVFGWGVEVFNENLEGYEELVEEYYNFLATGIQKTPWKPVFDFQWNMLIRKGYNTLQSFASNTIVKLNERLIDSNFYIFCQNIYESGFLTYREFSRMQLYFNELKKLLPEPDGIIFLDTSPEVSFQRIHNERKRKGEEFITLEYLENIRNRYLNWLDEVKKIEGLNITHIYSEKYLDEEFIVKRLLDIISDCFNNKGEYRRIEV